MFFQREYVKAHLELSAAGQWVTRIEFKTPSFEEATRLIDAVGFALKNGELERIRELVMKTSTGSKIEAIKLYRELTGAPLLEAKNQVEEWLK